MDAEPSLHSSKQLKVFANPRFRQWIELYEK